MARGRFVRGDEIAMVNDQYRALLTLLHRALDAGSGLEALCVEARLDDGIELGVWRGVVADAEATVTLDRQNNAVAWAIGA